MPEQLAERDQGLVTLSALAAGNAQGAGERLDAMLTEAARVLGIDRMGVWILDPRAEWLVLRALYAAPGVSDQVTDLQRARCPGYFRRAATGGWRRVDDLEGREDGGDPRVEVARESGMGALLDVPLFMEGAWLGVLFCEQHGRPRQWTPEEEALLGNLDDLVAIVLEAERCRSNEHQREREHARLRALSNAMRSGITFENAAARVVHANPVARAFMATAGIEEPVGMSCDEAVDALKPWVVEGEAWAERVRTVFRNREAIQGMPIQLLDGRYFEVDHVPVTDEAGEFLGHIWQYHDVTDYRRAEGALRHQRDLYRALSEVHRGILRLDGTQELLELVCRVAVEYAGLRLAWIGKVDPATNWIRVEASHGGASDYLNRIRVSADPARPEGRGPAGRALNTGEPAVVQDIAGDPTFEPWHDSAEYFGLRSIASVPLHARLSGGNRVLTVYSDETGYFDATPVTLLEELSRTVAEALAERENRVLE
jgi:GAF domain-containing protein